MVYTELQVTTNFSFLRGASHPEELVVQAAAHGYKEIAITDRNSFAGLVRAHVAAKKNGIRIIPACRLDLLDGPSLLAYPTNSEAYSRLCNLLTTGNLRAEKGECHLYKADVYEYAKDIIFVVVPPDALNDSFEFESSFKDSILEYKNVFGNNLYIAASRNYMGDDANIYFVFHNYLPDFKYQWLPPMMCIIMIPNEENYRISLPVSVKNVPSIMQDFVCIQMQKDI